MRYISNLCNTFMATLFAIILGFGMTSCGPDDYWAPSPPGNFNNDFYDSRLSGYWQLVQVNSYPVSGMDTNYMFFNGSGLGLYYYFYNGGRYTEPTAYWCQRAVYGQTNYQINITYHDSGVSSTMNYWFDNSNRVLYLEWRDQSGMQRYTYSRYPSAPW